MNAAANGPDNGGQSERERLFGEITDLKNQRNDLVRQLAECRRENLELRAQLRGES